MADKMTLAEHEVKANVLFYDTQKFNPKQKLTHDEFLKLLQDNPEAYHGVNHADRIEFLKANGYEVNRQTLVDINLSAKPKPEKKSKKR